MLSSKELRGIKNFRDLLGKVKHDSGLDSSIHTLKIYCLNSELSKEELFHSLGSEHSDVNPIGDFVHIKIPNRDIDDEINFYCYKDPDSPVVFILSIFGKGKLDIVVDNLIKNIPKTYYFWLPVSVFDQVKEEVVDHFKDREILIDYFSSIRSPHFKNECSLRPHVSRRMEYTGEDGLQTLREMRSNYGVFPKKINFKIDKKLRFSMDHRSTFIINYGLPFLDSVFEVIQILLSKFAAIDKVLSEVRFDKIEEGKGVNFEIKPLCLKFGHKKSIKDVEDFFSFIEKNEEGKYCVLNPLLVPGSLFFSATILDVAKKAIFSVSGNEEVMSVLPQINCGKEVISRFYEGVDLHLDNRASINTNGNSC